MKFQAPLAPPPSVIQSGIKGSIQIVPLPSEAKIWISRLLGLHAVILWVLYRRARLFYCGEQGSGYLQSGFYSDLKPLQVNSAWPSLRAITRSVDGFNEDLWWSHRSLGNKGMSHDTTQTGYEPVYKGYPTSASQDWDAKSLPNDYTCSGTLPHSFSFRFFLSSFFLILCLFLVLLFFFFPSPV